MGDLLFDFFRKNSPTFCVYPWIEQVVQPTGKISFCCVAKDGGTVYKDNGHAFVAGEDDLAEAFNSNFMRDLRQKMLNGESHPDCETCSYQESINKKSYRQNHNDEWQRIIGKDIKRRVKQSQQNGYRLDDTPVYLDLRLGNVCNLKCRMCNPYNSSKILTETNKLLDTSEEFREIWKRQHGSHRPQGPPKWWENEDFWQQVMKSIPRLKKVYLTGGEPTLIEKNYTFLQACVDHDRAKDIILMFNTNCTNINDRFLNLVKEFQFVLINLSIDGYGDVNEYVRSPSKWTIVEENFHKLMQLPHNVQIGVTPVIQCYNALNLTPLLKFVETQSDKYKRSINIDFLYANDPPFLSAENLPWAIRQVARQNLLYFAKHSRTYRNNFYLKNGLDSCVRMLEKPDSPNGLQNMGLFLAYTKILDKQRNENLRQSLPELTNLLEKEGFEIDWC